MEIPQTKEAFKALVQNIKKNIPNYKDPLAFGICEATKEHKEIQETLKARYLIVNSNENFASAAIFAQALSEQGVDFNESEVVYEINETFLKSCLNAFTPYFDEAYGDSHKNIQTILALYKQIIDNGSLDGRYKVVFIFKDEPLQSVEAISLKKFVMSRAEVK